MREELAATTYPKWFKMISDKLEENDPEGTGYSANGKLSIADLIVRACMRACTQEGLCLCVLCVAPADLIHTPTRPCTTGVQHPDVDRQRHAGRDPHHHPRRLPQGA